MRTPRETVDIDARVGGRYAYTMVSDASGDEFPTFGIYREVVPFERLVFTWGDPGDEPEDFLLITVTLEPDGERTRMTFDLRGLDASPGDGYIHDGWDQALDLLADHLARQGLRR